MINQYSGSYQRIEKILQELRSKCPWDKKQTIHSLQILTIEEVYELGDAIQKENWEEIKEELGDVFLHLLFYAKIAEEQQKFTMQDVIETLCEKLVHRHPHIYEMVEVADEMEVKKNWENLKLKAGKKSILSGVPKGLPALVKAYRIQDKVKQVGFEFENKEQVFDKIKEEIEELELEIKNNNQEKMENELGDVLFSIINYARFLNIDPEKALEKTNQKFTVRFQKMEQEIELSKKNITEYSLKEMDQIWNNIKNKNG
ncbi:MAG: nucleoside triphosphate pyrophosphohydrolase [Chitinophagaceae bacterium]|nr:nucleoside triphosphate pyrophosphohydrolase [Chitinophagaceae bacterium]